MIPRERVSYSAIVEPVFEYFGADDIHPGDVFFWNDPYNSSGGIGHVPDLCTTVPIFVGERLIGFSQVFGHHDDVGGSVPGSLPVHATDSWMEGMLIPPIKLYEKGKRNEAAFRIIVRNSRLSEHLKGDLDAEQGAARLGCRRTPLGLPRIIHRDLQVEWRQSTNLLHRFADQPGEWLATETHR